MIFARLTALTTLACLSALSAACSIGSADDTVKPQVEVIDRTRAALSMSGGLTSINGKYGSSCHGRAGLDWSVAITEGATLAYDALTVTKNDGDCKLSVTDIVGSGPEGSPAPVYTAKLEGQASPIEMAPTFATAKPFLDGDDVFTFYGNATVSTETFAGNFTITLLVSDTADASSTLQSGSTYAEVSADEVTASDVLPPDSSVTLSSVSISIDADDKVLSRSGNVIIGSTGDRQATHYAVVSSLAADPTFAQVDAAYEGATSAAFVDAAPWSLSVENILPVTTDLTGGFSQWLILRRDEGGVPAYKVVKITFTP
jgi:hypothetical protein